MGTIFVVNPGSTSRKYALYRNGTLIAKVHAEQTVGGIRTSVTTHENQTTSSLVVDGSLDDSLADAIDAMCEAKALAGPDAIDAVAMRVVAPGKWFYEHRQIDEVYLAKLEAAIDIVPIHIPIVLDEIQAVKEVLSDRPLWGISDSAFNATARPETTMHSLPHASVHRGVGFHGLSFSSIASRVSLLSPTPAERVVVIHYGGGISVGAIHRGELVATSMGTTPMSGVMMSTRGGAVAADDVLAHLIETGGTATDLLRELSDSSGFQIVANASSVRQLIDAAEKGDEAASTALTASLYQVRSWIASHVVLMGGVDALVLTATALERNSFLRAELVKPLSVLGMNVDETKNEVLIDKEGVISAPGSVPVIVMKTDEMGMMATVAETLMTSSGSEHSDTRSA